MFKCAFLLSIWVFLAIGISGQAFFIENDLYAIWDERNPTHIPENFRLAGGHYVVEDVNPPSREGLDQLRASGSSQFSLHTLEGLKQEIGEYELLIIDLRQESHGFINGKALSWTDSVHNKANSTKKRAEIEIDEKARLIQASQQGIITLNGHLEPQTVPVNHVLTERELIEKLDHTYIRLPVQDHHHPSTEEVDHFITLVKNLPPSAWIHIHCKMGKGRTTTFMSMYDMMMNAGSVSVDEIIRRQYLIGGSDLCKALSPEDPRYLPAIERLNFLYQFYVYCQEVPHFDLSWSEWSQQRS